MSFYETSQSRYLTQINPLFLAKKTQIGRISVGFPRAQIHARFIQDLRNKRIFMDHIGGSVVMVFEREYGLSQGGIGSVRASVGMGGSVPIRNFYGQ